MRLAGGHALAAEVQDHEVALADRPVLDRGERGELAAHLLQLLVDLLVGDLDLAPGNLDALVLAERRLWAHVDRGGELEALILAQRTRRRDLRLVDRPDVGLDHGLRVPGRQPVLQRLVVDVVAPQVVLDHAPRRLAWPEARNPDLRPSSRPWPPRPRAPPPAAPRRPAESCCLRASLRSPSRLCYAPRR